MDRVIARDGSGATYSVPEKVAAKRGWDVLGPENGTDAGSPSSATGSTRRRSRRTRTRRKAASAPAAPEAPSGEDTGE